MIVGKVNVLFNQNEQTTDGKTGSDMQLFLGTTYIHLAEVNSTNTFALELFQMKGNSSFGTVISANKQVQGRGQRGNVWNATPGENLTVSALLNSGFLSAMDQFYLTKAVSLALIQLLERRQIPAQIKWPNDILVNETKIAGILIENGLKGKNLHYSVIGIGLNVNQTEFPPDIKATSIKKLLPQQKWDTELLLKELVELLNLNLFKLFTNKNALDPAYLQHLLGLNVPRSFTLNGSIGKGIIRGVSLNGMLLLEEQNQLNEYNFKELGFILQPENR